ncbi:hypothetical protein BpHYR1_008421 [Brachionus plicatilis]|uniref:Uncharacterized protein n=1 Tax=Brachionus plicatilis TaxID=10195 RepID=A0A3M7SBV9_BRAPC|nr:hypothetical protein BpHYR1_008421 [Brachionus plicatilis]
MVKISAFFDKNFETKFFLGRKKIMFKSESFSLIRMIIFERVVLPEGGKRRTVAKHHIKKPHTRAQTRKKLHSALINQKRQDFLIIRYRFQDKSQF